MLGAESPCGADAGALAPCPTFDMVDALASGAACGMPIGDIGKLPMCGAAASGAIGIDGGSGGAIPNAGALPACGFSLKMRDAIRATNSGVISSIVATQSFSVGVSTT